MEENYHAWFMEKLGERTTANLIKHRFDAHFLKNREEAKKLMTDKTMQHFTLLSIAYDVGFNSKSSFNATFKKHTRMTPSQFKKNSLQ